MDPWTNIGPNEDFSIWTEAEKQRVLQEARNDLIETAKRMVSAYKHKGLLGFDSLIEAVDNLELIEKKNEEE